MFTKLENIYYGTLGTLGLCLLTYLTFFTQEYIQYNFILFVLLFIGSIILEKSSLKIGEFKVTLDTSIILSSYFILGLTPTLWLMLITFLLSDWFFNRIPKRKIYSNIGMFILIFTIAHFTLEYIGNKEVDVANYQNAANVAIFGVLVFLANWTFLFIQFFVSDGNKLPEGWEETIVWDIYGNMIIIPLSILLIKVYHTYDYLGVIIFLLVILLVSLLFKIFRNLIFMNNELRIVQEVAASISSRLDLSATTSNILKGISELVKCDCAFVLEFNKNNKTANLLDCRGALNCNISTDKLVDFITEKLDELIQYRRGFIIEDIKRSKMGKDMTQISKEVGSLIYEPLILENEVIGCMVACSKRRGKFFKEKLDILDILANQAVIAIENARLYKDAHTKAIKDGLTGLYNQRYFYEILNSITSKCQQCYHDGCTKCNITSLVIFDIDYFKMINDTYGHQTGDKILKDISKIIKDNVRNTDIVSRYGGEEFTVILPDTDEEKAYQIAERIREKVEETIFYSVEGDEIRVTLSGGVSQFPDRADSGTSLLAYADRAMYSGAKKCGRNKISIYEN